MPGWKQEIRLMPWIGLLVLLLFVTLPRFDFQTYLKPVQPKKATSGFTNAVNFGDFARELDSTVMMRVEPVGMDVDRFRRLMMGRYWRGTSLSIYNGNGWQQRQSTTGRSWQRGEHLLFLTTKGEQIALYREASDHPYIMLPDGVGGVLEASGAMKMDEAGSLRFIRAPTRRIRMVMEIDEQRMPFPGMAPPISAELDVSRISAEISGWAEAITVGASSSGQQAQMLMNEMLGWSYDLNAAIDAKRPVESFLNNRRGHCELYATLLTLSLRSLGVPARVVNGYFGGEWNEVGGFYLIRQQHAHSWVEAWVNGQWRRFDATPASRWQLTGIIFPAVDEVWESIKLTWYRYILEFQNSDRGELFQRVAQLLKRYLVVVMIALFVISLIWVSYRRGVMRGIFQQREWPVVDRWLEKHGVKRLPHQPLRLLPIPEGIDAAVWRTFVLGWEQQLYGSESLWSRREIRRHLRALS